MIIMKIRPSSVLLGLGVAVLSLSFGCSDKHKTSPEFKYIKKDLTPELVGISERDVDIQRNMAVVSNTNMRLFWSDLGRAFFFEAPSSLSPYDVVGTSGQPTQ